MIEDFQIKGLNRIVNTSAIMSVYPMVDRIVISYNEDLQNVTQFGIHRLDVNIFLNDPSITDENMYDKEFDPHYLVDYHLKQYFPYFGIKNVVVDWNVWGPNGDIINSWVH